MPSFYDALSGQTVEMVDWLDRTGSKERGRAARNSTTPSSSGGNKLGNRPGLGTSYTVGSHRTYNPKSTPTKVVTILDLGNNVDLLSPGNAD